MAPDLTIVAIDRIFLMLDIMTFGFVVSAIWQARTYLNEHPGVAATVAVAIGALAFTSIAWLGAAFELHRSGATVLFGGTCFALLGTTFSPGNRTGHRKAELARKKGRREVSRRANENRFASVMSVMNARMAEGHRTLKLAKLLEQLDKGLAREQGFDEQYLALEARIARLRGV